VRVRQSIVRTGCPTRSRGPARVFPLSIKLVNGKRLIYFDTAATAQRPREVIDALTEFYSRDNGNPAPNLHSLARRSFETYEKARATVATLLNANDPLEIVWIRGTTNAINLVASSWGEANIGSNDEIVLTIAEHSSNMLPWQLLAKRKGARVRYVDVLDDGNLDLASLKLQVTQRTKLVCFPHVSNVLGIINPADEICRISHQVGAKVLIDAAQSVPHFALDVQQLECDFLAFSGHKIMGPMGLESFGRGVRFSTRCSLTRPAAIWRMVSVEMNGSIRKGRANSARALQTFRERSDLWRQSTLFARLAISKCGTTGNY
jgi:selenocysteine lyase/cysteine desulfurase